MLSVAYDKFAILKQRYILWIGLLLYAASFFLIAVVGRGPARGYVCAYSALNFPWGRNLFGPFGIFENKLLEYVAVPISGWINPVFLITATLAVRERSPRMRGVKSCGHSSDPVLLGRVPLSRLVGARRPFRLDPRDVADVIFTRD
jgi:hypothetical protein